MNSLLVINKLIHDRNSGSSRSESSIDLTNFCVLTILGITTGSSSLVKHVSAGTLTSVTNFASSVSRNLDRLSLDSEHCQRNELVRRTLPQGVGSGLVNGMSGIGISILGAIGGMLPFIRKFVIEAVTYSQLLARKSRENL